MKKIKSTLIIALTVFCLVMGGCAVYSSVKINDWNFAPQQASGTEIDLSLISGSELEFDFTVKNESEARDLLASTFDVIFKNEEGETHAISIYIDNHKSSLNFAEYESKNIKLHAITTSTVSENKSIIIKYDGITIVEYIVKQ